MTELLNNPIVYDDVFSYKDCTKFYEELDINLYKDGLVVHTTLDSRIQKILEETFDSSIRKNQDISIDKAMDLYNKILLIDGIEQGEFVDKNKAAQIIINKYVISRLITKNR